MEPSNYQDSSSEDLRSGTPLFRFSSHAISRIFAEGLDLNHILALEMKVSPIDWVETTHPEKFHNWEATLIRKQFLTKEGKLSTKGAALLSDLGGMTGGMSTYTPAVDAFIVWWNTYPPTAGFYIGGKMFESTTVRRIKKMLCREHWNEILLEGEYTAEQIIEGTKNHFDQAMNESLRSGENKVQYIANSERYLRERMFAPFIVAGRRSNNFDTIDI